MPGAARVPGPPPPDVPDARGAAGAPGAPGATGTARLPRSALAGPADRVALLLLGARLVHASDGGRTAVRLTEVEAYRGEGDPGSHAYRGRTPRTAVMFGPAGHLYVYFTYGMHWCANVVCGPDGQAAAVLLRAGEVVEGHALARARRPTARRDVELARGPARLATALGISGEHGGADLCGTDTPLWLERGTGPLPGADVVRSGPRVGVSGAGGDGTVFPWRYWLDGEPTVSPYRAAQPRRRRTPGGERLRGEPGGTDAGEPSRPEGTAP